MSEVKLSPPWVILRNQIAYTVGLTPGVIVSELLEFDYGYEIAIHVNSFCKAKAIRAILPALYTLGNVHVFINIYITFGEYGDLIVPVTEVTISEIQDLIDIWCLALHGNPLYVGLYQTEKYLPPIAVDTLGQLVVIIDKKIVQFFDDNIGDLCQNYNQVAAYVFNDICVKSFNPDYRVSFTTYDANCITFEDLNCK